MQPTPLRAVGYRRVSSQEQTEGHSLDAQTNHIQTFVQSQGWHLIQIYTDAGISAKKGSQRPAFEQMLKDAKDGRFDVVVVDKIDRFYRHLSGLLSALEQLNSLGVSLASVQEKLDFTTPWGKLMLTVLGMLAEIYIMNLRQETKKGHRQRARSGLWNGGIPFGYCNGLCSTCGDLNGPGYCPLAGGADRAESQRGSVPVPHPGMDGDAPLFAPLARAHRNPPGALAELHAAACHRRHLGSPQPGRRQKVQQGMVAQVTGHLGFANDLVDRLLGERLGGNRLLAQAVDVARRVVGGERAPEPPPGYYPVIPARCPICHASVTFDPSLSSPQRGAGWRCAAGGSAHYWQRMGQAPRGRRSTGGSQYRNEQTNSPGQMPGLSEQPWFQHGFERL